MSNFLSMVVCDMEFLITDERFKVYDIGLFLNSSDSRRGPSSTVRRELSFFVFVGGGSHSCRTETLFCIIPVHKNYFFYVQYDKLQFYYPKSRELTHCFRKVYKFYFVEFINFIIFIKYNLLYI